MGYDGKPESLYRIENTAYQKMARYLSPFFGNKDTSIKLVRNALKSEFYDQENKKAVRPVSFCKMTRMEGNPIRHFIGDPKHLFSLNADVEILKMFNTDKCTTGIYRGNLTVFFKQRKRAQNNISSIGLAETICDYINEKGSTFLCIKR